MATRQKAEQDTGSIRFRLERTHTLRRKGQKVQAINQRYVTRHFAEYVSALAFIIELRLGLTKTRPDWTPVELIRRKGEVVTRYKLEDDP